VLWGGGLVLARIQGRRLWQSWQTPTLMDVAPVDANADAPSYANANSKTTAVVSTLRLFIGDANVDTGRSGTVSHPNVTILAQADFADALGVIMQQRWNLTAATSCTSEAAMGGFTARHITVRIRRARRNPSARSEPLRDFSSMLLELGTP